MKPLAPRTAATRSAAATKMLATPDAQWLLAAHVARWMDSVMYQGATLDDVATSFLAANADAQGACPQLNGALIRRLQERFEFMPAWQLSPQPARASAAADPWDVVAPADVDEARLTKVLTLLSEVPLSMALSSSLARKLAPRQPFSNVNVVMVQHMLGQAHPLVDGLVACGMNPANAEYVGVPYQQNPAVRATLENNHGVKVTVPAQGDIDDMYTVICQAVDRAVERHRQNGEPILILDDGGYASKYIATRYADLQGVFAVVEQTTRGLTEISKLGPLNFGVVNVGGSFGKRFENAQVGDAVKMAVRRVLDAVTATPTRKDVLVVGAGNVGEGVADSFAADGARVTIYDPFMTKTRKRALQAKGFVVVTDKAQALHRKFLVVGCAGHRSIDMRDFLEMSSPVFVASASSKRVEIDTLGLGELATDKDGKLRRILAAKINEQETFHYWLQDGRIVTAMADGLPVNFQAVNSIAPELIDHTMALMLLGASQAINELTSQQCGPLRNGEVMHTERRTGLLDLNSSEQFMLQAEMEGIRIAPTDGAPIDGERALWVGLTRYVATDADWQRIAASPATPPDALQAIYADCMANNTPMDPLALAVMSGRHTVCDATVDLVLQGRVVPQMAQLLKNDLLTQAQTTRVLDWLMRAYDASVWHHDVDDVVSTQAVAVTGDAALGWRYHCADVVDIEPDRKTLAFRISSNQDTVVGQLIDALVAHPQCPEGLRLNLMTETSRVASRPAASVTLSLTNPAWTTTQLDQMWREFAYVISDNARGKAGQVRYAFDVAQALRDHPNASDKLMNDAQYWTDTITKDAAERKVALVDRAHWPLDPAFGSARPDYALT